MYIKWSEVELIKCVGTLSIFEMEMVDKGLNISIALNKLYR